MAAFQCSRHFRARLFTRPFLVQPEGSGVLTRNKAAEYIPVNYIFSSLQDAARVCQGFMARDPSELHFTVVALAAAQ